MSKNVSVFSQEAIAKGRIISDGSVIINGNFEGNVIAEEAITLKSSSKVNSNLKAKNVVVAGELNGNVNAEEELTVLETGKIKGKMRSSSFKINKGATTLGKIDINSSLKNEENKKSENNKDE